MEDENFEIKIEGEVDLTKSDAYANGLIIAEGQGEMTLLLKNGEEEVKLKVHKIKFEGVKET